MVFKSTHKRFLNKVFDQDGFQYVILHEPPPEPVIDPNQKKKPPGSRKPIGQPSAPPTPKPRPKTKDEIKQIVKDFKLQNKDIDDDAWNFNKGTKWENIVKTKEFTLKVNVNPLLSSHSIYVPFIIRTYP